MTLKAVLFDFSGVILDDEPVHRKLVDQIVLAENLRPQPGAYQQFCLGRSDRTCLKDLLTHRGRVVTEAYLDGLVTRKAQLYQRHLDSLKQLPLFSGVKELISTLRTSEIKLAVVSGALRSQIKTALNRAQLFPDFPVIVAGDDPVLSKPQPDSYLLAVERLNLKYPLLKLDPAECLAVEGTFTGIKAAKQAGIPVAGVANTYPFHLLQRQANWTVDALEDLELGRIQEVFNHATQLVR